MGSYENGDIAKIFAKYQGLIRIHMVTTTDALGGVGKVHVWYFNREGERCSLHFESPEEFIEKLLK